MLNVILWLPLAVGLLCFLAPRNLAGPASVLGSLGSLGLAIALIADFQTGGGLQHIVSESWIPSLGVRYELAVDGISLFMILLTAIGWTAANLYSAFQLPDRPRVYFFQMGLAQTAVVGAFLAQDLLLFVLFFDLMLIPFYFLIGGWGTGDRIAATVKMIIYTLIGSLLMLVAAIATAVLTGDLIGGVTFNIETLASAPLELGDQRWIFWCFALAFLIKMPAFLVHGWMADAYRACPLPVLALLSGVLTKVAAYGFLRIVLPVFPDATIQYQEVLLIIGVASIIYGSSMAFTQTNVRLIAGYSSVAQLGFITLGIFALRPDGADGAVIQMFNHGLVVLPLFFIIAVLYERFGSEDIREMGGMAKRAPILAVLFIIVTMATLAIPGSANFVGEFYILAGVFENKVALALIASTGVALAAFYALRLFQRTMHNRLPEGAKSREITLREGVVIAPLVACIVGIALYPALILDRGEDAVERSVAAVAIADCAGPAQATAEAEGEEAGIAFGEECIKRYGLGEDEETAEGGEEGEPGAGEAAAAELEIARARGPGSDGWK
ncbi:MAG TPA: NADH-quinone oxidoreductase subunit M [Solirubrobacterales bacterium]|nr:NADH-quinone oxidoreductase subunit M [Solirubrobacterales bacterium]